jgi:two-component system CheB/CheR fusion protein
MLRTVVKKKVVKKSQPSTNAAPEPVHSETPSSDNSLFPIAGIGASAGGLEALVAMLHALPADTGIAFVIVQHLAPRQVSALSEILSKSTRMPVADVRANAVVQPNSVSVISPGTELTICNGKLRVTHSSESHVGPRPIDRFLQSLAEDVQARSIGIILSGTGTDGTLGLKAIKEAGGITFAQDATAAHRGMPESAIVSDCVDFVLPPGKIAEELVRIARRDHPNDLAAPSAEPLVENVQPNAFASILQLLTGASGINFTHYKQPTLRRRIERRMVLRRLDSLDAYLECLRTEPGELESLYHEMLIQVTAFFRDPETFEALQQTVFPRLIENRPADSTIRIWIPGCATGEEVYSIAICLLEFLKKESRTFPIKIFATDVSDPSIGKARSGIYQESAAADISSERLRQYFVKIDAGYQIIKSVRDLCIFARQDLTSDPPFSQLDLISCRNVLIYLGSVLQNRVIPVFHYALQPGGFLMLGNAESIGPFNNLFEAFDKKYRIYRRTSVASRLTFDYSPHPQSISKLLNTEQPTEPQLRSTEIQREADRVVLAKYAPPGVVIDENLQIIQFRGHTGLCLEPAPGTPSYDLLQMTREGLLPDLKAVLEESKKSGLPQRRTNVRVKTNSHHTLFHLDVIPIAIPSTNGRCFVVLFEAADPQAEPAKTAPGTKRVRKSAPALQEVSLEVARLTNELAATKAYLQSVIEAKEAGNEELKAANEEMLSSNEEMQSTNEEMETAKEELQATNEELATVNDELQDRILSATQSNDDLTNLIDSVNIPILMLSHDLRLRRFSPSAQKVLNLRPGDVGRHVSDFKPKIEVRDLAPFVITVLNNLAPLEREVTDEEGRWFAMQIRPYRTAENKIDGVIISLFDIDALKRKEHQLVRAHELLAKVIESLRGALVVLDQSLRVRLANRAFYELFQTTAEEVEHVLIYSLGGGNWNALPMRKMLDDTVHSDAPVRGFRFESEFARIGKKTLLVNAQRIPTGDSKDDAPSIMLSIEDLTAQETAENEALQSAALMQAVVETAADAVITFNEHGTIESINSTGEKMFQYQAPEMVGRPLGLFMSPPFNEFVSDLHQALECGRDGELGTRHAITGRRRDGSAFPIDLSLSEVNTSHGRTFTIILRDVSERRALEREVIEIAAYEQRRVGQDLHDTTGQSLSGLSYLARGLADELRTKSPADAKAADLITQELERVLDQVRRISRGLIPVEIDSQGLMAALESLVERVEKSSRIQCTFECAKPVLLNDNQSAVQLFLIAQEAVTNALKHAQPKHIKVSLCIADDELLLEVQDDGTGFAKIALTTGMGLKIMQYRADLINAKLSVHKSPAGGTQVTCVMPWNSNHA